MLAEVNKIMQHFPLFTCFVEQTNGGQGDDIYKGQFPSRHGKVCLRPRGVCHEAASKPTQHKELHCSSPLSVTS